jgi:hypothetical protein
MHLAQVGAAGGAADALVHRAVEAGADGQPGEAAEVGGGAGADGEGREIRGGLAGGDEHVLVHRHADPHAVDGIARVHLAAVLGGKP